MSALIVSAESVIFVPLQMKINVIILNIDQSSVEMMYITNNL